MREKDRGRRTMNLRAVFVSALVAVNVITLLFMAPLNSLILTFTAPICVTCLLNLYGGGILAVWCFLLFVQWWGGDKIAVRVQKSLSVIGLVAFLHALQLSSVPSSWNTAYVIFCIVMLAPAVLWFLRAERGRAMLVHQFFVILFVYEVLNVGLVMTHVRELDTRIASVHTREASAPLEKKEQGRDHVFWIVFDELSLSHTLQGEDFRGDLVPNLATFSRESTWYAQARTTHAWTGHAIPSLLLGKKDVDEFSEVFVINFNSHNYLSSMAGTRDVFIAGGYMSYCLAFQQVATACRDSLHASSSYLPLVGWLWDRAVPGVLRNARGGVLIERLATRLFLPESEIAFALNMGQSFDRPTFTYIHEKLPHPPYQFNRDGSIALSGYAVGPSNSFSSDELEEMQEDYRNQIAYADSLFGTFIATLKARNLYDRSFIVVMSDHGISFDPPNAGRILEHEQVYRIPFLIRSPGQSRGEVNPSPVYTDEFFEILLERKARVDRVTFNRE